MSSKYGYHSGSQSPSGTAPKIAHRFNGGSPGPTGTAMDAGLATTPEHPLCSRMNRLVGLLVLPLAVCFFMGNKCEPSLLTNPGFELWCDDQLCGWSVDEGEVQRVPTWHSQDYGAELVGDLVVISQVLEVTSFDQPECLSFDMVVDVEANASLTIEMDFLDDGHVEYSHPIPSYDWTPVRYDITPPSYYTSVRFIVRKEGSGRVVLGKIRVSAGDSCTAAPLELLNRPNGAPCDTDEQCPYGDCRPVEEGHLCTDCATDADCPEGTVCGADVGAFGWMFPACKIPGSTEIGEACSWDFECSSGVCCASRCAECCVDDFVYCPDCPENTDNCASGQVCGVTQNDQLITFTFACAEPNQDVLGDLCVDDDECISGHCCGAVCSECCQDDDCGAGQLCGRESDFFVPYRCDPGRFARESGEVCFMDEDCTSASCVESEGGGRVCL